MWRVGEEKRMGGCDSDGNKGDIQPYSQTTVLIAHLQMLKKEMQCSNW